MKTALTLLLALSMYGHGPRNNDPCGQCTCKSQNWSHCSVYCYQRTWHDGSPRCMTMPELNGCYDACKGKVSRHEGGK
jgi:hypothetical protein